MLRLTPIEFFLRLIPEMMIFMWGIYVISREKFKFRNYMLSSLILALASFWVRELPINYGVHTIINNVLTICILIVIEIPIIKGIYSTLAMTLLLAISEILNMFIIKLFNINLEKLLSNTITKCILGIPSLVILSIIILLLMLYFNKKEGRNSVSN